MNRKLLIIGAGGHGKVAADIASKMEKWDKISFLDDNSTLGSVMGYDILGPTSNVYTFIYDHDLFVAIGDNKTRYHFFQKLESTNANLVTLIHPSAVIGEQVSIGVGTVIMPRVVINCCTKIGKGCILNTGSTVDHDNIIEDFVHISPGVHLAGGVRIGTGSWLGIGSTVSNNITITSWSTVGAGGVVIKDLSDPGVYVGVPVRRI